MMQVVSTDEKLQNAINTLNFEDYNDDELAVLALEMEEQVDLIELETEIFESYLARVSPNYTDEDLMGETKEEDKDARRAKKGKVNTDRPILLNIEQMIEIAAGELEQCRDKSEREEEECMKNIDNAKAELEEYEIRHTEVKKALYDFKRDIEGQATATNGKITSERIIRYSEEKIKAKDTVIEKILLKNTALKTHMSKLLTQLKQKEEMGEDLHAIDFDQLQIENKQCMLKIEERNVELLKLKSTAGNTTLTLNSFKKKLSELSAECSKLTREIQSRRDLLQRLSDEHELVEGERVKALKQNQLLIEQVSQYSVPEVMDYVLLKASKQDLEKTIKGLTRKIELKTGRIKAKLPQVSL